MEDRQSAASVCMHLKNIKEIKTENWKDKIAKIIKQIIDHSTFRCDNLYQWFDWQTDKQLRKTNQSTKLRLHIVQNVLDGKS